MRYHAEEDEGKATQKSGCLKKSEEGLELTTYQLQWAMSIPAEVIPPSLLAMRLSKPLCLPIALSIHWRCVEGIRNADEDIAYIISRRLLGIWPADTRTKTR